MDLSAEPAGEAPEGWVLDDRHEVVGLAGARARRCWPRGEKLRAVTLLSAVPLQGSVLAEKGTIPTLFRPVTELDTINLMRSSVLSNAASEPPPNPRIEPLLLLHRPWAANPQASCIAVDQGGATRWQPSNVLQ